MNSVIDGSFFIIINDITEIKSYSEEMKYLATYDTLTSIFNRRKLIEYGKELIENKEEFSLYFIDLDNFKKINDSLGHDYGDKVLISVSQDLIKLASKEIKIGRLGGDEFVIIKKGNSTYDELKNFSTTIKNSISKSYNFKNFKFKLKSSIGVAYYPLDGKDISTIIKYADIAMYHSKSSGGNCFSIFEKSFLDDYDLEDKLKIALTENQLITYYQPIYNINNHKIDTVEALVRWESENGLIPPNSFIPLAKRTGLIVDIDKKVFEDSCILCKEHKEKYGDYLTVSINISYGLLIESNFSEFIISTINKYNIPPSFIKLEITEDEIIKDLNYVISILNKLRKKGILIALDDFGVGYSSFNYIKKLPLDTIKIDKSLIFSIENDKKSLSIIQTLITLSKSLNLEVVCEGVEVKNQLKLLETLGCDKIQGYLFSKPIIKDELYNYMDNFIIP